MAFKFIKHQTVWVNRVLLSTMQMAIKHKSSILREQLSLLLVKLIEKRIYLLMTAARPSITHLNTRMFQRLLAMVGSSSSFSSTADGFSNGGN